MVLRKCSCLLGCVVSGYAYVWVCRSIRVCFLLRCDDQSGYGCSLPYLDNLLLSIRSLQARLVTTLYTSDGQVLCIQTGRSRSDLAEGRRYLNFLMASKMPTPQMPTFRICAQKRGSYLGDYFNHFLSPEFDTPVLLYSWFCQYRPTYMNL